MTETPELLPNVLAVTSLDRDAGMWTVLVFAVPVFPNMF